MIEKITKKIKYYCFSFLAIFMFLGLNIAEIFLRKKIIFCTIHCDRIGALAIITELFLRRLKSGKYYDKNTIYIGFCYNSPISNQQLLKMFRRTLLIVENNAIEYIFANTWMRKTRYFYGLPITYDEFYECNNLSSTLLFTDEEKQTGKRLLAKMGIKENDWFVCFHARDSKYLANIHPEVNYRYHNFRDCDIDNYLKAAEYIAEQGGYAIRMGAVVDKPLPKNRHPRIIDYATDYRSDFMDIYLIAHCKYLLGSTTGILTVATIFYVPIACANYLPLHDSLMRSCDQFIPKRIWSNQKNRYLTFKEIFDIGAESFYSLEEFESRDLKVCENSPDEIYELVREMDMSLKGEFILTPEDEMLRQKIRSLFNSKPSIYHSPANINTHFLRQNKELLEGIKLSDKKAEVE